jgi:hypothetical protein
MILMCLLLLQLWSQYSRCIRGCADPAVKGFTRATGAAFGATLLAMIFGGAEITIPQLWLLWGMLAAGLRHAWSLNDRPDEVIYLDPSSIVSEEPLGLGGLSRNDMSDKQAQPNAVHRFTFATM